MHEYNDDINWLYPYACGQLVFSDEFNEEGRRFSAGSDPCVCITVIYNVTVSARGILLSTVIQHSQSHDGIVATARDAQRSADTAARP